jgi:6-phosphogluconolactonase (cycloisomerase 2 family)
MMMQAYVGCRTTKERKARGHGLGVYAVDAAGGWHHLQTVAGLENPSFLARAGDTLYAVHGDASTVSAFRIASDGCLTPLGRQETGGRNPVHLVVHEPSRSLVVANYATGSVALLPLRPDGGLEPLRQALDLPGQPGPHRTQQTGSEPHQILVPDSAGHRLIVPDKGLDRVFVIEVDAAERRLRLAADQPPPGREGSGPRHAMFHPSGATLYVANELDSTVTSFAYDTATGRLSPLRIVSTLPPTCLRTSHAAGIAITPCGRWLYVSNRGDDSITTFSISPDTATLYPVAWTPGGGAKPRFITLDPAGTALVVANEDSDSIVFFAIDAETGTLTPTGQVVETGSPVCVIFADAAQQETGP